MGDSCLFFPPDESALRVLLDESLTAIFIVTPERICYANSTFLDLLGYKADELRDLDPWAPVCPAERETIRAMARERMAGQRIRDIYETRMVRKDGQILWVEVRAAPVRYRDEPAVLVNMVDISERKRVVQALAESEERFRSLFENAPLGIYRAALEGRVQLANPALLRMLGFGPSAMLDGELHREGFDPTYPRSEFRRRLEDEGEVRGLESAWIRRDDSLLYVRESARLVRDAAGEVLYYEGSVEDITERKRAEQAMQLYAKRLHLMQEVDRAILGARSSEEIAQAAIERIRKLVSCERAVVLLIEESRKRALVAAVSQEPSCEIEPEQGTYLPITALSNITSIRTPARHLTLRANLEVPILRRLYDQGIRSLLTVPLRTGGEIVGALHLASSRRSAFDSQHEKIAVEVGDQLAIGLRQTNLLAALRAERASLKALVEHLPEGLALLDANRHCSLANPAAVRMLPMLRASATEPVVQLGGLWLDLERGSAWGPYTLEEDDAGRARTFVVAAYPVPATRREDAEADDQGSWALVLREVTEEREVIRQLRQQQRLAAIGELAGGVAHDFANLLTAISGYTALLERQLENPADLLQLGEIQRVCGRGAALTRRLLDFGRPQNSKPTRLDLVDLIEGLESMLRRLLGAVVQLSVELAPDTPPILSHREQMEQVLVNLCVNARDAMPKGGKLRIQLEQAEDCDLGRCARLTISDTGVGMSTETIEHIFEPFFTTREGEGGTGLGLSTVHGIVEEAGGRIQVHSEPGAGTLFELLLPAGDAIEPSSS
ncbi:MAG: PAS domain S-box protein [Deltaproteobacteria bacterium]|nr:PAS domain S-box protein [Deltaproteobacteria bacterium]